MVLRLYIGSSLAIAIAIGSSSINSAIAQNLHHIGNLPAFIAQASSLPAENLPAYTPKPLGEGYAVLVDYFNQPEIATQVQQAIGKEVGLVSYAQKPYLLALHTSNERNATNTLQRLSDRGFWVILVDSKKVTLLKTQVETSER